MFTNDNDYLLNRTDIVPTDNNHSNPLGEIIQSKKASRNLFVQEMRLRLDAYYKIVLKNVRDSIPKTVGFFLVRSS